MRKSLVTHLICPRCSSEALNLEITDESHLEVRAGTLICATCAHQYAIVDGVVELLPELDAETRREREARAYKPRDWEIERARPFINDMPATPWVWPSFAANVQQGLEHCNFEGGWALDIGPATCWSTRMLAEQGAQAIALDISTEMLRDGEAQFKEGVYFDRLAGTMESIPLKSGGCAVVFASASIHHASNLQRALQEIARVLKPGGRLVLVNEPVCGWLTDKHSFGRQDKALGMNEHIYRLRDYVRAANQAGLKSHVLFPAALEGQLEGLIPSPPGWKMRTARRIWRGLPRYVRRASLGPAHELIGLSLIMVGEKQERSN